MERGVFLQVIDREWQEFLRAMDDLRTGVSLRAYGQRDPLIEYKKEAFEMFEALMTTIKSKVVSAEFRSATAARLQAAFNRMAQQAQTNAGEFDADAEADATGKPSGAPVAAARDPRENAKTIGDLFASMMSRPPAPGAESVLQVARPAPAQTVGRNDPCPCGSGKKYKKCCGKGLV
jgi:preprotein translocase subunit SecA